MTVFRKKRRSSGFTLVELAVTVALLSIATVLSLQQKADDLKLKRAAAQGTILKELADAVTNYATQNQSAILNGAAIPHPGCTASQCGVTLPAGNVVNTLAPTMDELIALGYLVSGFKDRNLFGVNPGYAYTLTPQPINCLAAGPQTCVSIESLTHLTAPILTRAGKPDVSSIGEVQLSAGEHSGASLTTNSLSFPAYGNRPNPVTAQPLGIVAMLSDTVMSTGFDLDPLLPRDGSRPMTANLNLGNQSVINGNQGDFTGRLSANGVTSNGSLVTNNTTTTLNGGRLTLQGAALTINNQNATILNRSLGVNTGNVNIGNGSLGVTNGHISLNSNNRNNIISDGINRLDRAIYHIGIYKNNGFVPSPTCKNGTSSQIFTAAAQFAVGTSAQPIQQVLTSATPTAGGWFVNMEITTTSGSKVNPPNNLHDIVAFTKCT